MDKNTGQLIDEQMAASAANTQSASEAPVTPVRSAKDAINAMYAQGGDNRLSSYLAASAKDIINASRSTSDSKSAANLHQSTARHRMEVKPSASGMLKTARSRKPVVPSDTSAAMDPLARKTASPVSRPVVSSPEPDAAPVVKTSLKLGPKKPPMVTGTRTTPTPRSRSGTSLNGTKSSTALQKLMASKRAVAQAANTQASIDTMQRAARQATGQPVQPAHRTSRGKMQDIVRPARPQRPATPIEPTDTQPPADSVKRRFRAAPKGYTATATAQPNGYVGYEPAQPSTPHKEPIEIYGLMDEEPTGKPADGLGVVEDYHPQGDNVANSTINEQKVASGSGKASPDNNKYTLGGQSPFFLKSVSVEKRPLSDAPIQNRKGEGGTLYEKPSNEPLGGKNIYEKKESKKPLPTKPTVIIPASRRSRAPLVALLILTVILGAAVGAFIYLCFFQYME